MMKFGLTDREYKDLAKLVIDPLKNTGARVYVFGSRARGTHQRFSDIDILVESSQDLSKVLGQISEALEQSNFPYKIDLVEERNLAPSYVPYVKADRQEVP